jgi:RHS repeat-associated protein
MESTQIQALYEPPPAAMPQLSEKPRQGFETRKTAGKPGSNSCNFTVTLGLQATVVENGVRGTYSARYYNPQTGRFLSRDPEDGNPTDPASLHKYLYANGDPINGIDPMGRETMLEYLRSIRRPIIYAIVGGLVARPLANILGWISEKIDILLGPDLHDAGKGEAGYDDSGSDSGDSSGDSSGP